MSKMEKLIGQNAKYIISIILIGKKNEKINDSRISGYFSIYLY